MAGKLGQAATPVWVEGSDVPLGGGAGGDASAANQLTEIAALTALTGTPITGQSLEAGGAGVLGWLASIWKKIAAFGTAGTPSADVITVQGITNGTALPTKEARAATPTLTNVAASATSVTVLVSNTARLGAAIYNDSSANLYLKLGATASATSFTILISAGGYYEVPFNYTGIIDGIWASATGAARVTEVA